MNPDKFRAEDFEAAHQYMSVTVTDEEHLDSSNLDPGPSTSKILVTNQTSDREKSKATVLTTDKDKTIMSRFSSYSGKRKQGAKRKLEIFTATSMKLIIEVKEKNKKLALKEQKKEKINKTTKYKQLTTEFDAKPHFPLII